MNLYLQAMSEGLEKHFTHVQHTRMADVPILNPALKVQAVGFHKTEVGCLGILITPWFINLMLLPCEGHDWVELPIGAKQTHVFASGSYEFIIAEEQAIGRYQACSLLSPVLEIQDQDTALEVAHAALNAIQDPQQCDIQTDIPMNDLDQYWQQQGLEPPQPEPEEQLPGTSLSHRLTEKPISRRDFFRGRFLVDE